MTDDEWTYRNNEDNSARFVLATHGANPFVCVGVNPSTAAPGDLDVTVSRVSGFASRNGFDSWAMLNLYPQRSTDPRGMHPQADPELKLRNEIHIEEFVEGRELTLVGAWGELIGARDYLPAILADIYHLDALSNCRWFSIGDLLRSGHPRHPSRAAYALELVPFAVGPYLLKLGHGPTGTASYYV